MCCVDQQLDEREKELHNVITRFPQCIVRSPHLFVVPCDEPLCEDPDGYRKWEINLSNM